MVLIKTHAQMAHASYRHKYIFNQGFLASLTLQDKFYILQRSLGATLSHYGFPFDVLDPMEFDQAKTYFQQYARDMSYKIIFVRVYYILI